MAKLDFATGEFSERPAQPEPVTLDDVIAKWYKELDSFQYESKAHYAVEGLSVIFTDTVVLRSILARIDTMLSKSQQVRASLVKRMAAAKALLEDSMDKSRIKPENLVSRGFAYTEREAVYRSNPSLISARIKIRELDAQMSDVDTFVKVATARYRFFEGCRSDQLLLHSLIKMGWSFRELGDDRERS